MQRASRWLPQLRRLDVQPDEDPFKYESITANAICQAVRLENATISPAGVKRIDAVLPQQHIISAGAMTQRPL